MARIWRTVIDEGANHQLFEGRVWESVRLARLSQGHHKGIRVTSATTLMYSHGRGARGAVAGLDISRRVVTHVAQTGKTKRLPMLIPLIIHILPYRPTPPILASAIQRLRVLPHPLSSSLYAFSPT